MIALMIAAAASVDLGLPQKSLRESNDRQLKRGKCRGKGCALFEEVVEERLECDSDSIESMSGNRCTDDCKSGSETCCGVTYDSVICNCISGIYSCYPTGKLLHGVCTLLLV